MKVSIRPEQPADYPTIFHLVEWAFRDLAFSDQNEQYLVDRLRHTPGYVPELALVAEHQGAIVGHILLTEVVLRTTKGDITLLTLAPVSVSPPYQKQGFGSQLIEAAHRQARAMGYPAVALIGHPAYYPRFGYQPAAKYGITLPFDVPEEAAMVLELYPGSLSGIAGHLLFHEVFFLSAPN